MLRIITVPNKILRQRSAEIDRDFLLSAETKKLIKEMIETMYVGDGIGLAAPQIGKNIRICVIGKEAHPEKLKNTVLINPTWQKTSRKYATEVEGCLSIPKTWGKVKRWKNIHLEAYDVEFNPLSFDANGYFARVIQHEVDHLDGILFIDKAKGVYMTE
ncbi:MAG: peptide deformylase [Patescibacteria group bacterium]